MQKKRTSPPSIVFAGLLLVLAALTSGCSAMQAQSPSACHSFSYRGEPIQPALVQEFEPYVSDDVAPITVMVNVSAAQNTNEYFYPVTVLDNGQVSYAKGQTRFSYQVIGCSGGDYVLRTYDSGGGSGVFESVLIVSLEAKNAYGKDGLTQHKSLFMTVNRRIPLGDRDTARVTLQGDVLTIGKSRYRKTPLTITLED